MSDRKVAVVTAAAGAGIGAAIVQQLASDGFEGIVTDVHARRCGEFAQKLEKQYGRSFMSLPLDVVDFDAVGRVMQAAM